MNAAPDPSAIKPRKPNLFSSARAAIGKWMTVLSFGWLAAVTLMLVLSSYTTLLTPSGLRTLYLWITLGSSLAGFVVFAWDKRAARKNKRRIPEKTLHILAIVGGWAGAVLGQQLLRHKTQKWSFRALLPMIAGFHMLLFVFVFMI